MTAAISILVMALLFVAFGLFRLGGTGECGGSCGSCSHDCELADADALSEAGRLP